MTSRLLCIAAAAAAAAIGLAGAASAQTLPNRDDPGWEPIGAAENGTQYAIMPSRLAREHTTVWLVVRATVAPLFDEPNTVVAYAVVDCAASEIGVGTAELYNGTQGFLRTIEGPEDPVPAAPVGPGQRLVIRHVCVD